MKYVYIDFEYNSTQEEHVNPVCVAWMVGDSEVKSCWLYKEDTNKLNSFIEMMKLYESLGYTFVSYSWEAECRAFLALGIENIATWKAVDLYLEYRMLLNNNNQYAYGKQLIRGKQVTTYPPPTWLS